MLVPLVNHGSDSAAQSGPAKSMGFYILWPGPRGLRKPPGGLTGLSVGLPRGPPGGLRDLTQTEAKKLLYVAQ